MWALELVEELAGVFDPLRVERLVLPKEPLLAYWLERLKATCLVCLWGVPWLGMPLARTLDFGKEEL